MSTDSKKVKVKVLMHMHPHVPGDVIEVDEETAKHMLNVVHQNFGGVVREIRKAVTMDHAAQMDHDEKNPVTGGVTKVANPKDSAFEERMEMVAESDKLLGEEKAKKLAEQKSAHQKLNEPRPLKKGKKE